MATATRRVALLGSRSGLASLRQRVSLEGSKVILEIDTGASGRVLRDRLAALAMPTAGDSGRIDVLVVLTAADGFSSVEELLAGLEALDGLGIEFQSLEEPWLVLRGSGAKVAGGEGSLASALEGRAAHFLDLSIERLEADNRASTEQRRREAIQAEVGKVVGQLLVLGPYAVVVAIVSQAVLNAALLDPELLLRRLRDLVSGSTAVTGALTGAIPDALRGVVFTAISSLVLLVFRGTSIGLRAELGGTLFMGLVTLAIYGLTAGFGTGIIGSLVALPGLVLAVLLTFEFTHMVLRITSSGTVVEPIPATGRGILDRIRRVLSELGTLTHPTRSKTFAGAFVAIPALAVLISLGAAATQGGGLFWPARIALFALVFWSAWACLATPSEVRIPLWSMLAWSSVLLLLSAATVVTAVFAVVIVILLAGTVFELVFHRAPLQHTVSTVPA